MRAPFAASILMASAGPVAAQGVHAQPVDFDLDVLPILSDHCFQCHGPDASTRKAGLRLDLHDDVLFVTEPGSAAESELWDRLVHKGPERRMPPADYQKPLTQEQIATLGRWIDEGVVWESHWAFEGPWTGAEVEAGPLAIDSLVDAALASRGLERAVRAPDALWFRRVSLHLTGLPPALEAQRAFEDALLSAAASGGQAAVRASVVDRLLGSRAHAEHRTREWLDLARYADTNGYQNDFRRDQWPWRDWVLRAFERNLPYDRFVVEQVAGDLVPDATAETILGTGFQRNHRTVTEGGSIDEEWRVENVADRAETTATAFLGLTLACARCHDHKYDPLTQVDYYRFYAFFDSIDEKGVYEEARGNVAPILRVPTEAQLARLAELDGEIASAERARAGERSALAERFEAWAAATSEAHPPLALPRAEPLLSRSSLQLSGVPEEHVALGTAVSFEEDRAFTVSTWLRPRSHGAVYSRMDDDDRYRGTDLVLLGDMRPAVHLIHRWTDNAIKVVGESPLQRDRWQHVAVVYDGSRQASGVSLLVDGREVKVAIEVDALDGTIASEEPLRLGQRRYAGALRGELRAFRIDGEALTREQVLALAEDEARRSDGIELYAAVFDGPSRAIAERLAAAQGERARIERDEIPTAMVLRERAEPRTTRVLLRGSYDAQAGEALTPDVPAVFGGLPEGAPRDRLGLARWLVGAANPLTARVAVNRVWASFFGVGLVATPDDFGTRGARPEHGELLDALARDFVRSGWDLRALERRIALSETYAQISSAAPEQLEVDPENRWLARGPRHRLDAEVVRDQALAAAGLLRPRWGGPAVKPYQPAGLWAELAGGAGQGAYVPSEGDDLFRRSVYTYRKRTVPHPTLTTFDAPGFELCAARRARTNTPLQALALLNDVTYVEAARGLGARMMGARGGGDRIQSLPPKGALDPDDVALDFGVRALLSRPSTDAELEVLRAALARHRARFEGEPASAVALLGVGATAPPEHERTPEWAAFTLVASTLLNLDEAVMLR